MSVDIRLTIDVLIQHHQFHGDEMIFNQYADGRKVRQFSLSPSFIDSFKGMQPKWGPLGHFTFRRTYSRDLPGGGSEEFWQVCQRVVEGCFNIQKIHCHQMGLPWNEQKAQHSAQDMFQRMWDFKFSPPGRGLSVMGTDIVYQRGSASLQNCSFVSSETIGEDFADPFCFLMDMSMLGVGTGADTKGAGKTKIITPKVTSDHHIVPDTREGWVDLIRVVLNSFAGRGAFPAVIDYSQVRGRGKPLKTFGGVASGPKPLHDLVVNLVRLLLPSNMDVKVEADSHDDWATIGKTTIQWSGQDSSYRITSTQIVDIFNFIGKAVVAGGIRRCLPKGTFVHTDGGLIRIEDVKVGQQVLTSKGYSVVTDWVYQGKQSLASIQTQMGSLECTDKHKIAILSSIHGDYEWKKASELVPGDRMIFVDDVLPGTSSSLPDFVYDVPKHSTTCKNITLPELDLDVAWFIGYFHGDGYCWVKPGAGWVSVTVHEDHKDTLDKCVRVLKSFGVNVGVRRGNGRYFVVSTKSKQLATYLHQLKQANTTIDVPDFILRGAPDVRASYVAGLSDADGSYKQSGFTVAVSVHPAYLKQVQVVLSSLGIPSKFKQHKDAQRSLNGWQDIFELNVVGEKAKKLYVERIAKFLHKFEVHAKTNRSQHDYGFPSQMALNGGVSGYLGSKCLWSRQSKQITVATLERLGHPGVRLVPVEVLGVAQNVREDDTYDLSVEANEFVANGYLVHNTAEIMFGDPDDKAFMELKQDQDALNDRRWTCVSGDTMVDTKDGSFPISSLVGKNGIKVLLDGQYHDVSGVKLTGHEQVFRVSTYGGPSVDATGNHLFMTSRGWVPARELKSGDHVRVSDNAILDEVNQDSQDYKHGYLLGSLIGDGSFTVNSTTHTDIARILVYEKDNGWKSLHDYVTGIFDFPTRKDFRGFSGPHGKGNSSYHFLSSKALTEMAAEWGVIKGHKTITEKMESGSCSFVAGVLSGLMDADGTIPSDGRMALDTIDHEMLYRMQRMLMRLGIKSRIYKCRDAGIRDFLGKKRKCKSAYRIILAGYWETNRFVDVCGIHHSAKLATWKGLDKRRKVDMPFTYEIVSVEPNGFRDVFDACVPSTQAFSANGLYVHNSNNSVFGYVGMNYTDVARSLALNGEPGLVWLDTAKKFGRMNDPADNKDWRISGTNPCGEMGLESRELCNLVETYPAHHDSYEDFERTLKMAYLYAKTVTLVPTHDMRANAVMMRNRRIGASMSGIVQAIQKFGRRKFLSWCDNGYKYIQGMDRVYSDWLGVPLSVKTTTVKPSGCRPWYALTSTNRGLLTLEDLLEHHPDDQDWAVHPDHDLKAIGTGIISKTYNNGVSPVLRITTSYGIEVESTPDHQWWIKQTHCGWAPAPYQEVNAWRRAGDIRPGDILDIQPGIYNIKEAGPKPIHSIVTSMRGESSDIHYPVWMNSRLAWLLGYLWGDGAMLSSKCRFLLASSCWENLLKVQVVLKEQFGIDVKINLDHQKAETLDVESTHLWYWLIRNDVFKPHSGKINVIPKVVRTSSQEDILAFLAGMLDSDGWVEMTSHGAKLVWAISDEFFARHVQDVALAVGLVLGRSHVVGGENSRDQQSMWHLTQSAHVDAQAFEMFRRHSTKVAAVEDRSDFTGWYCGREDMTNGQFILGEVIKVEMVGTMPTYDIEVEDEHWYYAGAIKSHNTVSLLCGATPGIHFPHSEYYIRHVRVQNQSPLCQIARDAGYQVFPDAYADNTSVVAFPVKEKHFIKGKAEVSLWEQFVLSADMQGFWSDNLVSATVTFKKDEVPEIKTCLEAFETRLKGVSLLPLLEEDHGYVYPPYQAITEQQYLDMVSGIKEMDFPTGVHDQDERFCSGEACMLALDAPAPKV